MNEKIPEKFYQAMRRMALRVSADGEAWRRYLAASGYLYKYESYEQLLIYGFKPDCTAVAAPAVWRRLGYSPRQDAPPTVIRLPGNRTLYDISDVVQRGGQPVSLWNTAGVEWAAVRALQQNYQLPDANEPLETALSEALMAEVERYLTDNSEELEALFGANFDDTNLTMQILASSLYAVGRRCGITGAFPEALSATLDDIPRYRDPDKITLLNHAVWRCAGTVLRQIERAVTQERSRAQKRSPLERRQQRSRPPAPSRQVPGQIRLENIPTAPITLPPEPEPKTEQAENVTKQAAPFPISPPPPEWDSSTGSRYIIWPQEQNHPPYGVWDTRRREFAQEQNLPILFFYSEHAAGYAAELEQKEQELQASEQQENPVPAQPEQAAPISRREINAAIRDALREWNGSAESKRRVANFLRGRPEREEAARWLRQEYGDDLPHFPVPAARRDISWNQVLTRVERLIERDEFFTDAELDALAEVDPAEVRENLAENGIVDGEVVDTVKLDSEPFVRQVRQDAETVASAEKNDEVPPFTESEIDNVLRYGSGFSGGKLRISALYQWENSAKKRTAFLRSEYGTGGHSYTFSDGSNGFVDYNGKGITLRKYGSEQEQRLTWAQADKRLAALIGRGAYLNEEEQVKFAALEQEHGGVVPLPTPQHGFPAPQPKPEQPAPDSRFLLMETDEGYAVWDDSEGEIYTDADGVQEEFTSEWQAEDYRRQLQQEAEKLEKAEKSKTREQSVPEYTIETQEVYSGEKTGLPYDVEIQTLHFEEPEQELTETPEKEPEPAKTDDKSQSLPSENAAADKAETEQPPAPQNFRITDEHLGEGGPKAKFRANIMAIQLLKKCEAEQRPATPEEQEILSRYVGWGGLADAFDAQKENWATEYLELRTVLTPEEYTAARASVLNAHYTSPTVIRAIYDALERMGFETGRILEPAMGVGNFFGLLPETMRGSELSGVELDSITGRIAQKLYPAANITVAGFETTNRPDYYDLALGNAPFGNYSVDDPAYNRLHFSIHNYFAAKMIDQVRPGGIVAFVTSRYTMDSKSSAVREHLAQKAELLGAIRLPNNAFRANAGTDVVTDILFFQKREHPIVTKPDWLYLDATPEGFTLNSYFVAHPEMILGQLSAESTQYAKESCTVLPIDGASLADQLREAVSRLPGGIYRERQTLERLEAVSMEELPADPTVPNYSYCVQDDKVYFKTTTTMQPFSGKAADEARIAGMVRLRDLTRELIQCQLRGGSDEEITGLQQQLNAVYDTFVEKNGYLSTKTSKNRQLMREDASWSLLSSLEERDSNGNVTGKADLFTRRTVRHIAEVTSCQTAGDALMVCLNEGREVNLVRIMQLTGKGEEAVLAELKGRIYRLPHENRYVTAEEYLSGNVRQKLAEAEEAAKTELDMADNVQALREVQPVDLTADEISVRLGTPWVPPTDVKDFICELLQASWYQAYRTEVIYSPYTSEWRIEGKNQYHGVLLRERWGTPEMDALKIIERTLNQQEIRVNDQILDEKGVKHYVLNQPKTIAAKEKQAQIQNAFRDWIFKDPERRERLVSFYNQRFNATRPREYDGSHLTFAGMSPEITLMPHQKNAVARALYGGNTLLAHVVGAGKTYEIATIAMEAKRLGISHKSMIVVPNHITEQWGQEFQRLYPGAKLLVTTDQDFTAARRRQFCTRIAAGDWDAVIIGDSQFKMIPMSLEYRTDFYQREVDELTAIIEEERHSSGQNWSVKAMERAKKAAEGQIRKLMEAGRKDSVITFEELGVDRLFVDESHLFKNLGIRTKMANVAGIGAQESSERANDMYMKCRYLDEITGGTGIVFATGTPISNSMSELYTVCKYLAYDRLQQDGLLNFDAWAAQYGETVSSMELAPEGTGYRTRTRFARFVNLPELMNMYHDFADVKLASDLNLKVPEAVYETVVAERSAEQSLMMEELSERASRIRAGVDPKVDNMLKVTNDGRKLGLDQRLIDPTLPDDPESKVNLCVDKLFEIWDDTREERAAQMVFCDTSTPHPGRFNVYDDMKKKLLALGVPEEEIAFIHDAKTRDAKQQLFLKVRQGEVRILFGSTSKMGAGTNAQDRLLALHNLDCPWVPSSLEQRAGRIIRQGNRYEQVKIFNYVTNGTFDSYLWQTVENKQRFIGQIMTGRTPVRSCEDVDETALSYAEVKALCIGNPLIKTRAELDTELTRLKMLKSTWQREQYRLSDRISRDIPSTIGLLQAQIKALTEDVSRAKQTMEEGYETFKIDGKFYSEQKDGEAALLAIAGSLRLEEPKTLGSWRGFYMTALKTGSLTESKTYAVIHDAGEHRVRLGAKANFSRIRKALDGLPEELERAKQRLETQYQELEAAKETYRQPWPYEAEFQEKTARLIQVDAQLSADADRPTQEQAEEVQPEAAEEALPRFDALLAEGKQLAAAGQKWEQAPEQRRTQIE